MKTYFLALAGIFLTTFSFSTNFFISSSTGNDINSGLSEVLPFATLKKLNTLTLAPGDTVFFKRGDKFRGTANISQSGTSASPIVFTAYGSGNNPIISGAEPVTGWTTYGNMYRASFSQTGLNFFVNDVEMNLARYPNSGYLQLDNGTTSGLSNQQLSQAAGFWNGAKICIHNTQWSWEKTTVSGYASGTVSFSTPLTIGILPNYGYFFYDKFSELDTAGEWFMDAAAHYLYYFSPSGQAPSSQNCEASAYSAGILILGQAQYITIRNLVFEKQSHAGVQISGANNKDGFLLFVIFFDYNPSGES